MSVCSGIEAASVAWNPLGWRAIGFSEIEPFPCAVLAHHYPDVPNLGDMNNYKEWPDATFDVLCGGTPCQSFSNAGLRKGLDDPRGNLMLTFGAIAAKYRPRWLVWENVPGVLSSNDGRDFASFLGLITGQRVEVPAGGWQSAGVVGGIPDAYGAAYRVLDAQFAGLAQRRKRVFVVAYLGDWRRAAAVLLERESLLWNPAPRRGEGEDAAPTIAGGARKRGGYSTDDIPAVAATIDASYGRLQGCSGQDANHGHSHLIPEVCGTLTAGARKTDHATKVGDLLIPMAFGGNNTSGPIDVATAVRAKGGTDGTSIGVLAFSGKDDGGDASKELAPTLRSMSHAQSHANGGGQVAVAYSTKLHNTQSNQAGKLYEEYTPGLDANSPPPALITPMQVRRLMPVECERLQGFPDDYTNVPFKKRRPKDGPRYKAIGNSWPTTVVRWIGERIDLVDTLSAQVIREDAA